MLSELAPRSNETDLGNTPRFCETLLSASVRGCMWGGFFGGYPCRRKPQGSHPFVSVPQKGTPMSSLLALFCQVLHKSELQKAGGGGLGLARDEFWDGFCPRLPGSPREVKPVGLGRNQCQLLTPRLQTGLAPT